MDQRVQGPHDPEGPCHARRTRDFVSYIGTTCFSALSLASLSENLLPPSNRHNRAVPATAARTAARTASAGGAVAARGAVRGSRHLGRDTLFRPRRFPRAAAAARRRRAANGSSAVQLIADGHDL